MKDPVYIVRCQEDGDYLKKRGLVGNFYYLGMFDSVVRSYKCDYIYINKTGWMRGNSYGYNFYKKEGYTTFLKPHEYREDLKSPITLEPVDDNDLTLSELAEKLRPMRDTYVPYLDRVALERKEAEEKLIAEVRRGRE